MLKLAHVYLYLEKPTLQKEVNNFRETRRLLVSHWTRASYCTAIHWLVHTSVTSMSCVLRLSSGLRADVRSYRFAGMSKMWTVKVFGLGAIAFTLSVELLWRLLRHLKPRKTLNEVLFFPSKVACVERFFSPASLNSCGCPLPHGVETSFTRLLGFLLSASSSLDLCLFSFSNMELSRAVVYLYRRKVTVRVLVDKTYSVISGSQGSACAT
ncbi:mitochondrial cardiolipin hydrolase [Corythoichthys intestinalis]|uniref:mitochondrial cardiolipin hydrolase n=1 Tax=Corythoichthys intestinalis TaxID=161448 RepID=UPI0025A53DEB|nr:mitochondrial cardiolipin hydrolase [Corythoichthys intestinalis]